MFKVDDLRPMLARPGTPPVGPKWAFEFKWDGIRGRAAVDVDGSWRLFSRVGNDVTSHYPDLAVLGDLARGRSFVLDGELVALDEMGRPVLRLIQSRHHAKPRTELLARIPARYYAFDLLALDGESVRCQPYAQRRELLEGLGLVAGEDARVQVPPSFTVDGWTVWDVARAYGLEGVVGKRTDSPYAPGYSWAWVKTTAVELAGRTVALGAHGGAAQ